MSVDKNSVTKYGADDVHMGYRGRVFGRRVVSADVRCDPEAGTVWAWDDIAEHWTMCHSITDRGMRDILAAARNA